MREAKLFNSFLREEQEKGESAREGEE